MPLINPPAAQTPGVYHKKIGEVIVTAVSDGGSQFPFWPYYELEEQIGKEILEAQFEISPPYLNTNCFLIHHKDQITLIDSGIGMGIGNVLENIKAAGVRAEDIQTVLLTHLHPDHSNGLIGTDGTKVFPNAEIVVNQTEYEYWMDNSHIKDPSNDNEKVSFQMAQEALAPYAGKIRTFTSEEAEPVPGIKAIEAYGHTPGHTAYMIESGDDKLLIWGDIIHNATIQLSRPDAKLAMDVFPDQAIMARKRILDYAAKERLLVTGMHLAFPGFGHIRKESEHYLHIPEFWKPEL